LYQENKTMQHFAELISMQKDIENELVVQAKFIKQSGYAKFHAKTVAFTPDYRCGRQRDIRHHPCSWLDADADFRHWYLDTGYHGPHQWIWRESKTSAPYRQVYHPEIEQQPFSE